MLSLRPLFLLATAMQLLLMGCADANRSESLEKLMVNLNEEVILSDPFIHESPSSIIIDYSPSSTEVWFAKLRLFQQDLHELDTANLNQLERVKFETALDYVEQSMQRYSFRFHSYPISHLHGPHLDTPTILHARRVASKKDIEDYLDELIEVENQIKGLVDALERRRELGMVLPSFIIQQVIIQCDSLASLRAEEHLYYTTFAKKLDAIGLIDPNSKSKFVGSCLSIVKESIIPAHKRLAAYLRQLQHTSMAVAGAWQFPQGDAFYNHQLRWYTGLELNSDELYELGKQQLDLVESEIEELGLSDTVPIDELLASTTGHSYNSDLHRLNFTAFVDGIYLLRKSVDTENGSKTLHQANYLQSVQLVTSLMLIDIGIHRKQWIREQAIVFLSQHSTLSNMETNVLVDRAIVYPGLLSSASVGFTVLKELHENNRDKRFINQLDSLEPTQLNVLKRYVQANLN